MFTPTPEQKEAAALFATGRNLAIEAGAGTGKTSTLIHLAGLLGNRRAQYIAFNKAIVTDAQAKMPRSVTCSTAHSLAFRAVGRRYAARLKSARMSSQMLARALGAERLVVMLPTNEPRVLPAAFLAGLTMRAVVNFCHSADTAPARRHVPYVDGIDEAGEWANNRLVADAVLPLMRKAWADLADPRGRLPFRHDHYLKIWQLSDPVIDADVIFFDEAQDANPVIAAIVAAQTHAQLVFVGDSQQQIYSFTGAVNALAQVPADDRSYLTQSFRFGQPIADVANVFLGRLDAQLRLTGTPTIDSTVAPLEEYDAVLCRTNAAAVSGFMAALVEGRRAALVGSADEVTRFCEAAIDLQAGTGTTHPELACFADWAEVERYVADDQLGGELRLMVKLINDFTAPAIIDALRRAVPESSADVVFSTAHKAKGREWNRVRLAADFVIVRDGEAMIREGAEELRLLYVAVTRARRALDVTAIAAACGLRPAAA